MKRFLKSLQVNARGAATIEFAIIGPALITLMLGVFQIGVGMQAYNALRSVAMDTARYAVVEYQKDNSLSDDAISTWARDRAVAAPYLLANDSIAISTTTPGTQRVTGASERTLSIRYTIPTYLSIIGLDSFDISYSRSIFVPL